MSLATLTTLKVHEPKNRMMTQKLFQVKRTKPHGQVLIGEEEEEEEEEENEEEKEKEEEDEDDDDDEEPLQVGRIPGPRSLTGAVPPILRAARQT